MAKHFLFVCILLTAVRLNAQDSYSDQVRQYIAKYYQLAVAEQKTYGIPAAVTLAQGIHESDAGTSDLTVRGNNHFGIKCKADWTGDTIIHSDNRPDECFKKYSNTEESYRDHSEHLKKNPRYAALFALSPTDYAAWAIGLKNCGYATNPQYSMRLIKLIEDYHLQQFTYQGIEGSSPKLYPAADPVGAVTAVAAKPAVRKTPENDRTDSLRRIVDSMRQNMAARQAAEKAKQKEATPVTKPVAESKAKDPVVVEEVNTDNSYDSGKVVMVNGLKAFYGYKDEMLLKYAVKYKIRYAKLLEMNDLPDAPLPDNMPVYLEKKLPNGTHSAHTVKKNENMLLISQTEGIQLKRLYALNLMEPGQEPATGAMLELQNPVAARPELLGGKKKPVAKVEDAPAKKANDNEFVAVSHPKPEVKDTTHDKLVAAVPEVKKPVAPKKQAVLKEDTAAEDLTGLKAELDRVVYADNSKLRNSPKGKTTAAAEKTEAPEAKAPAKEAKPAKKVVERKQSTYVIKKGDTLTSIAEKFHVTVRQLREWNDITGSAIRDGKTIRVVP
jgi:nucleoid-associated protein YgaU